jgi:hypothetical protein
LCALEGKGFNIPTDYGYVTFGETAFWHPYLGYNVTLNSAYIIVALLRIFQMLVTNKNKVFMYNKKKFN